MLNSQIHIKLLEFTNSHKKKQYNYYYGKRNKIFTLKNRVRNHNKLICQYSHNTEAVGMKLLCAGEWQDNSPLAKQKYLCNMHLHVLFCQRRFALLFPNPISTSLTITQVRAAMVILYTVPFMPHDSHQIYGYARGMKQDIWISLLNWYIRSLSHCSWPRGPNSLTIKLKLEALTSKYLCMLQTYTSSSRVPSYSINWCIYIYIYKYKT